LSLGYQHQLQHQLKLQPQLQQPVLAISNQQPATSYQEVFMGKGDRRTRRGKINRSSYGKNRKRKPKKKTKTAKSA
jgi:ribosomal small subunit protein bTHX